jgi:hypothetical protein
MPTIKISQAVWDAIAARGKFGETEEVVLRRVFGLPTLSASPTEISSRTTSSELPRKRRWTGPRKNFATTRMTAKVDGNSLEVSFAGGSKQRWKLPLQTDKRGIRAVRDAAVEFASKHDATIGQQNAVKKALTDARYFVSR